MSLKKKIGSQNLLIPYALFFGTILFFTFYRVWLLKPIFWGAWIAGDAYGVGNPPWDTLAIDIFEEHTGKKMSILHWGQPWWHCEDSSSCRYQTFDLQKAQYDTVRKRGYIPLIDWASYDYEAPELLHQPEFSLSTIIAGQHDEYIRQWATQARDWGHPFFLRFNWEMNGRWFPWSEGVNGNQPGEYVQAWRHVHDIFTEVGAQNVTWVWCPNVIIRNSIHLETLYPGDEYVDWLCMDGYNSGTNPLRPDRWRTFAELFGETYSTLVSLSPNKPIMIAEVATTEVGGSKAAWIHEALTYDLPSRFPAVKAIVWFNWSDRGMDWAIESSLESQRAFAEGIGSSYYIDNKFSNLRTSPIPQWVEFHERWPDFPIRLESVDE
jgi:mannan endo-1,4-beta-mannosidase